MATAQKTVRAVQWISYDRHLFKPGEPLNGRLGENEDEIIAGLLKRGEATDAEKPGDQAQADELARREDVKEQIEKRSRKREHNER